MRCYVPTYNLNNSLDDFRVSLLSEHLAHKKIWVAFYRYHFYSILLSSIVTLQKLVLQ